MWDECNCAVVWASFGIAFLWDWNENWPFPFLWPLLSFPNLLTYWVQHFHSIIFQDLKKINWNSITSTSFVCSDAWNLCVGWLKEKRAYQVSALMPKVCFVIGAAYIPNHSPSRKKKKVSLGHSHLGRFSPCVYSVPSSLLSASHLIKWPCFLYLRMLLFWPWYLVDTPAGVHVSFDNLLIK